MNPHNRVAVALALEDTTAVLETLRALAGSIGLAEVRLDLMRHFDLERLISAAPCPLVVTCRPRREGGAFDGGETDRLGILSRASALGCAYVDVEWDCVDRFDRSAGPAAVIASRHHFDGVPPDVWQQYADLRGRADVVKLVGMARDALDALVMLDLAARADTPVIALAMGDAGAMTRLAAPCFEACLLTYAAVDHRRATAPGQISVRDMIHKYAIDRVSTETLIEVHTYTRPEDARAVAARCGGDGARLRVPLRVEARHVGQVTRLLTGLSPRVSVVPPTVPSG